MLISVHYNSLYNKSQKIRNLKIYKLIIKIIENNKYATLKRLKSVIIRRSKHYISNQHNIIYLVE